MPELPPPPPPKGAIPKPPPRPSKPRMSTGFIVAMVIAGLFVLGAIVSALDGESDSGSSSSESSSDALTERTCEIARDISADVSDGVDTIPEARDRFRDLLNGYGEAAPSDIAGPLRSIVSALTNGETVSLEIAVSDLDSACSSRGF